MRKRENKTDDKQKSIRDRATKRIMKDLLEIKRNPLQGISALPLDNNIFLWHANLLGPVNTPWEGGIFHMTISIPTDYPNNPPSINLSTKISHPNVSGNKICLDILESNTKGTGWSPSYTIQSLLIQLQSFLFEAEISKILANIENPKDYEVKKKEWLSGVKWSVEQSINFKDSTVGHYPPKKPWPPLNILDEKYFILSEEERINSELQCYYTKQTYLEDALGYGVTLTKNLRTGELKSIFANLDFVSLRAFNNHNLRKSSTNTSFTHWLPVYINDKNGKKAIYLTEKAISIISTGTSKGKFNPLMVLEIYPKLMSTMIVEVMTDKKTASLRSFRAYYSFYRTLAQFVTIYPEIKVEAEKRVSLFIKDEKSRHKDVTPNLGEFLSFLSITDFKWEDIKDSYLEESFSRNVFWLLNKHKEDFVDENSRLTATFECSRDSYKILCFHLFFLKSIKSVKLQDIDKNFGFPTLDVEE
jgi:ubiquitin-protein ligase